MLNFKRSFTQYLIILFITLIAVDAYAQGIKDFYGTWRVDFELTLEEVKKSPKYSQEQAAKMPAMIKRMMNKMKIRITESEMIYLRGTKEISHPFTVVEENELSTRIECNLNEQIFHIDFTLVDSNKMNFKSSGSDDMNYYVWKPVNLEEEK